jgi:hypothetical protein
MNKLMCWGVLGAALVVGGYRALRNSPAATPVAAEQQMTASDCGGCGTCCGDVDDSANHVRTTCGGRHRVSPEAPVVEESCPARLNYVIDLEANSAASPPAIFIPDTLEAPPPLPAVDPLTELTQSIDIVPLLMPYCDDDDSMSPKIMPYADGDVFQALGVAVGTIAGWFEDSEPGHTEPVPACREDDNLSHQYSGCPAGGACPATKQSLKVPAQWHHDKEPILPVRPDLPGQTTPVRESSDSGPQAFRGASTLLRHTVLKVLSGKDGESPARQHVDTLEMRPSDLRHDDVAPDNF